MIQGTFDSRTLAKMNLALDLACKGVPNGEDHAVRKRIARQIIKYARSGETTLDELTAAGQRAAARLAHPPQEPDSHPRRAARRGAA